MRSCVLALVAGIAPATLMAQTPFRVERFGPATGRSDVVAVGRSSAERPMVLRYAAQAGLGLVGSWSVGGILYFVVDHNANDRTVVGDAGYSPTANWVLLGASAVGAAVGVHTAGRIRAPGSFTGTLLGSALATAPFMAGADDPYLPYYLLTLGTGLQILGGIVGGDL